MFKLRFTELDVIFLQFAAPQQDDDVIPAADELVARWPEGAQIGWAVDHLKNAGRIHDLMLWLGGVDRPMRIVAERR